MKIIGKETKQMKKLVKSFIQIFWKNLFFSYVNATDFQKKQAVALKLFKPFQKDQVH
jgi:hypothetical protein